MQKSQNIPTKNYWTILKRKVILHQEIKDFSKKESITKQITRATLCVIVSNLYIKIQQRFYSLR